MYVLFQNTTLCTLHIFSTGVLWHVFNHDLALGLWSHKCFSTFLTIKPTRYINSSNFILEWNSICFGHFLCPSSGVLHCTHSNGICHTGFLTACKTAMVYVIQVCWELASRIRTFHRDTACKLSANLYDIYHCCVYREKLLMMGRRTVRNMQSFIP
jgi:hypothetical protein